MPLLKSSHTFSMKSRGTDSALAKARLARHWAPTECSALTWTGSRKRKCVVLDPVPISRTIEPITGAGVSFRYSH